MNNMFVGSGRTRSTRQNFRTIPFMRTSNERLQYFKQLKKLKEKNINSAGRVIVACLGLAIFLVIASAFVPKNSAWMLLVIKLLGVGNAVVFIGFAIIVSFFSLKCEFLQREIENAQHEIASDRANSSRLHSEMQHVLGLLHENRQMSERFHKLKTSVNNLFAIKSLARCIPIFPKDDRWINHLHSNIVDGDSTETKSRKCCDGGGDSSTATPKTESLASKRKSDCCVEQFSTCSDLEVEDSTNIAKDKFMQNVRSSTSEASNRDLLSSCRNIWTRELKNQSNRKVDAISYQEAMLNSRLRRMVDELVGKDPSSKSKAVAFESRQAHQKKIKTKSQIEDDEQLGEYISLINNITINGSIELTDENIDAALSNRSTVAASQKSEPPKPVRGGKGLPLTGTRVAPQSSVGSSATDHGTTPQKQGGPFQYYIRLNPLNPGSPHHAYDCLNDPPNNLRLRSNGNNS